MLMPFGIEPFLELSKGFVVHTRCLVVFAENCETRIWHKFPTSSSESSHVSERKKERKKQTNKQNQNR